LQLKLARFADHEGAADLGVIALDARREFGRDEVAGIENLAGWRRHAAHLASADADDHEVLVGAYRTEEAFDLGHQFVILATGPRRGAEDLVTTIGQHGGAPYMNKLLFPLVHKELLDQLAAVREAQFPGMARQPVGEKIIRGGCDAAVAAPEQEIPGRS